MIVFSIYTIPPLLSSILFLLLGSFVYSKNRNAILNITFALVCFATFWWQFSWFILFNTQNETLASYLVKIGYVGIIFIPVFFFHFFLSFLKEVGKFDKYLLYLSYLTSFIFVITLTTSNYFINGFYKYYWGFYPKAGLLHPLYLLLLTILAIRVVYLLYSSLEKKKGIFPIEYYQTKYMLWGIIFYIFASSDFLVNYGIEFYPFGFLFILIFLGITAYAIIRYRLMDIRVVAGRTVVYVLSFGTVILFGLGLNFGNLKIGQPIPMAVLGPLTLVLGIILYQVVFRLYEKLASRYFYYTFYSYQKVLTDLGKNLAKILDLDKLSSLIVNTLIETMKLDKTVILLRQPETGNYQIKKNIGFREENGISLVKDDFLTQYLEKTQKPLVYEELAMMIRDSKDNWEKSKFEDLRIKMKKIEAALCLPLLVEEKIIGLIVLGNKISGDPYSEQDIELLVNLSHQSSIALQNARLYSQLKKEKEITESQRKIAEERASELEKWYKLTVGRELRMVELKQKIEELEEKLRKEEGNLK